MNTLHSLTALTITVLLAAPAYGAPGRQTRPGRRTKPPAGKSVRGKAAPKRPTRRGLPVLRSRDTPGRTRTQPTTTPAGQASNDSIINPDSMDQGAAPPTHVKLSASTMKVDNVSMSFDGRATGSNGLWRTESVSIDYPLQHANGRDLILECRTIHHIGPLDIEVLGKSGGTTTIWDSMQLAAKQPSRESFKVLIDTQVPASTATSTYKIRIGSDLPIKFGWCTLDLLD